ncbi:CotH kinase family protein [bacterium]|nr:CotH kinase family protein [bacterium]
MKKPHFPKLTFYPLVLIGFFCATIISQIQAAEKAKAVKLSHDQGFYEKPFTLTLRTSTTDAQIRYTINGSIPEENSGMLYSEPLIIAQTTVLRARGFKEGMPPSKVKTRTFLFPHDIIRQSPDGVPPPGFPYAWGPNRVDYGMDPRIVNDPAYKDEIIHGLKSLPAYSIVTDVKHLFDAKEGIYANAQNDGREWERPASVELLHLDGDDGFQIDCGIRIRGGFSRMPNNPKHAFRLFFRKEYGESKLKHRLFGKDGAKEFDNLDLRCSSNYSWHMGDPRGAMIRDQINRDLQLAMGQPAMRGDFCHLFINGHYWGLYNTCERPKAGYGAAYLKGKKEDFDAIKVSKDEDGIMATDGNLDAWREVYTIAKEGLSDNAAYFGLQGRNADGTTNPDGEVLIDMDNVIDYAMIIFYGGNLDGAITWFGEDRWHNNWHGIRNRNGNEGFKFFIWDAEHTFLVDGMNKGLHEDRTGPFPAGQEFGSSNPQWLWQQCLDNKEFRIRAADRIHDLYYGNGLLTPEAVRAIVTKRMLEIESAVICESARWGDAARRDNPLNRDNHWRKEMNRILNSYIPKRSDIVLAQLFRQGILPDFDPATISKIIEQITMSAANGTIYYTLDGTDPRMIGGKPSPEARVYQSPVDVSRGTTIKSRVLYRDEWSVLSQFSN